MDVEQVIPRDAIPSVDDPGFGTEFDGDETDEVVVVEGSTARAYPVRILRYHEIVTDVVDGLPLAVTWCPLCGSAAVYERFVGGRKLTFGVSGKLADDALVLYDRETESEWKQTTGRCLAGEHEGAELVARPSPMLSYGSFRERYPEGQVLQPPGGTSEAASDGVDPAPIDYDSDPYADYHEREGAGLAAHRGEGGLDRASGVDLAPKERVLGVEHGGDALAFPRSCVDGLARAAVGGLDVVVFDTPDGLFAFEAPDHEFKPAGSAGTFRGDGTRWDGVTGEAADGRRLARLPARRLFVFAWVDDHGSDAFYPES